MINIKHLNSSSNTAVIILAAGSSSRLGKPKQLLDYQQETLIKHVVRTALQICETVIVVTGFLHEEIVTELENFDVEIVQNLNWQEGMGSSIQTGITYLQQLEYINQINSVMILLSDQPLISVQHLQKLQSQFYLDKRSIAVTAYAEIQGVPAIFDKSLFPTLQHLPGDRGAQWLFKQYQNQLSIVPFEGAAIDIDTEEDYLRLIKLSKNNLK